jgi:hypothetical protein
LTQTTLDVLILVHWAAKARQQGRAMNLSTAMLRGSAAWALVTATLAFTVSAHAALNTPVTVSLVAPGGVIGTPGAINVTDVVSTASGITVGDSTSIGSLWMLPGESISFIGNTIRVVVAGGQTNANNVWVTGYLGQGTEHASYVFDNLSIGGAPIASFTESHTGQVTGGASVQLTGANQITFNLDALTFSAPTGASPYPYADFTLSLVAQPVPEPGSMALIAAGLLAMACRVRARRR